jgi:hypothetical protein
MSRELTPGETGTSIMALFHETLQRLGRQSAHCKLGAALALAIILVLALQAGNSNLLWAAAPMALLALADGGYAAQARRVAEFGRRLSAQKDLVKSADFMQVQEAGWGFQGALSGLSGFLSFTVWPFYLCLAAFAFGLGSSVVPTAKVTPNGPVYPPGFVLPSTVHSQQSPSFQARPPYTQVKPQPQRPLTIPSNPISGTSTNGLHNPVRPTGAAPAATPPGASGSAPKVVSVPLHAPAALPRPSGPASVTAPPAATAVAPTGTNSESATPASSVPPTEASVTPSAVPVSPVPGNRPAGPGK